MKKEPATHHPNVYYISTLLDRTLYGKASSPLVPKMPDPTLLKVPVAHSVPVKIPLVAYFNVVPELSAVTVPVPDPTLPAILKRFAPVASPRSKLIPLDPVPTVATVPSNIIVPPVVPPMLRVPVPAPKPPVGPVKKGVMVE